MITKPHHCPESSIDRRRPPILSEAQLRSRLRLRQLALVVAIAERRSLRRAAADVAVTQPAATRMLAELEDALGVPLFERAAWGMTATPYGESLIRYARGMLTELGEVRDEIAALAAGARGKLRVGAETGVVPGLLVPALDEIRRARPRLRVFVLVNSGDVLVAALRQGLLDIAIGQLPADADANEFVTTPLRDEPLCVVARVGHAWSQRRRLRAVDFDGATWIVPPSDSSTRAQVYALFARAGIRPPREMIETVSIVATLALLEASDAVTVLPTDLADHYGARGLVARLPFAVPAGTGSVTELITRRNRPLAPAVEDLAAALRARAATSAASSYRRSRPSPRRR